MRTEEKQQVPPLRCAPTGEVLGLGPTQGDEKRGSDRSVHPSVTAAKVSAALPFVIPSEPGFPATLHWTQPRVLFSVGENRMKSVNANKINRKSGEAEGSAVLFPPQPLPEVFFDRVVMGLRRRRATLRDSGCLNPINPL